jgi:Flp pilus assembly protein TadG
MKRFLSRVQSEDGSAVVEFVVLAIPLFLPIILFMGSFADVSDKEAIARTLARESIRGFVLSHSDLSAYSSAHQIATQGAQALGLAQNEISSMNILIQCFSLPCITPRNRISLTVTFRSNQGHREIKATAEELLSPWV